MKVAVVTGSRAEYGIWRPVLRALADAKGLELQVVVTGMHLLREFGHTVTEIERDGWAVAVRVGMYRAGEPTAASLARGTAGLATAFRRLGSEVVLVLGDRLEILAAAQAAMCEHRLLGHVHGGEVAPGQFDEQIRHAVTKLAQVHFAATPDAGKRIVRMGEDPARVFVVGAPAVDTAVAFRAALAEREEQGVKGGCVLVLHPTLPDEDLERRRTRMVVRAVLEIVGREGIFVVGPNNDPGHQGILRGYREEGLQVVMSLGQEAFWRELWRCGLLVGNSSSGIIEAATFRCAAINIGSRQDGRERSGNVLDVGFTKTEIATAVRRALSDKTFRRRVARGDNVYGDGQASGRIAAVLQKLARRGGGPWAGKRFHDA